MLIFIQTSILHWLGSHDSGILLGHTKERQSVIEPSPPLIEALVRNSEPLDLLRKHAVPSTAEELDVELIQLRRVGVTLPVHLGILRLRGEGGAHALGSVRPSRALGAVGLVGCVVSRGGCGKLSDRREGRARAGAGPARCCSLGE